MKRSEKCFGCYQSLDSGVHSGNYHNKCSKKLFATEAPPLVGFGIDELEEMTKSSLSQHLGITGVQAKISVDLEKRKNNPSHRLMIVGLWGEYILKPPTERFPLISLVEDVTMHMAEVAGITTARHGLIQLRSGELVYVTRRFDREKKTKKKIATEDFCQLSGLLTESKYDTSTEKAGKIILKFSSNPGLDAVAFFDLILFSFVVGNADMHLKNFSLIRNVEDEIVLSPAYDLLSTKILLPADREDLALTVNGKKTKIRRKDFVALGENLEIEPKAIENSFKRILDAVPGMKTVLENSFLPDEMKKKYDQLLMSKLQTFQKSGANA